MRRTGSTPGPTFRLSNSLALGIAILSGILLIGVSLVRFPRAGALLGGVLIGIVVGSVLLALRKIWNASRTTQLLIAAGAGIVIAGALTFNLSAHLFVKSPLSDCSLTIRPVDMRSGSFVLQTPAAWYGKTYIDPNLKAAGFQPQPIELPQQTLHSSGSAGFLTRLVDVPKPAGNAAVTSDTGVTKNVFVDFSTCDDLALQLRRFPAGTFYQADHPVTTPESHPFGAFETTSWKVARSDDPTIQFSYLAPPLNEFRLLLTPILGLSSIGQAAYVLLSTLLTVITWPRLASLMWDRLASLFGAMGNQTGAWSANYSVATTPDQWVAGQTQTYSVMVTNIGGQAWSASGKEAVHLDVHFGSAGGGFAGHTCYAKQRFNLPADIQPGITASLTVGVTAPSQIGKLVVEYHLIRRGKFWFSEFADVSVSVVDAIPPAPDTTPRASKAPLIDE